RQSMGRRGPRLRTGCRRSCRWRERGCLRADTVEPSLCSRGPEVLHSGPRVLRRSAVRSSAPCVGNSSEVLLMNAQGQITPPDSSVESFIRKPRQVLIDGRWVAAKSGKTFEVYDPSSGAEIAKVAACEKADVDAAVAAARKAFDQGT